MQNVINCSIEKKETTDVNHQERPRLKMSDLSRDKVADLSNMFGVWKEADHCDKD